MVLNALVLSHQPCEFEMLYLAFLHFFVSLILLISSGREWLLKCCPPVTTSTISTELSAKHYALL